MHIYFVALDIAGNLLRWAWMVACVAILYFLADAVFYHGAWINVGFAIVAATILYSVTNAYDTAFYSFTRKRENPAMDFDQITVVFTAPPRRRTISAEALPSARPRTSGEWAKSG